VRRDDLVEEGLHGVLVGDVAGEREPTMTPLCASGTASMTPAQKAHRFRMLAHLTRASARRR